MRITPLHSLLGVLLMAGMLTGCGYQLRGTGSLPAGMSSTYIQDNSNDWAFRRALGRSIQDLGGKIADSPASASLRIVIDSITVERESLSVADSGKVSEYRVIYAVDFHQLGAGGTDADANRLRVSVRDSYQFDSRLVLAKASEEKRLLDQLRMEAAQRLLDRLR